MDLIYYYSPETTNVFCGRHHGDLLIRRCYGCDEVSVKERTVDQERLACHVPQVLLLLFVLHGVSGDEGKFN